MDHHPVSHHAHGAHHEEHDDWMQIERVSTTCPICADVVYGAQGRGFCPHCFITFALPKPTRKQVLSVFQLEFYMSKNSPFYHRAGCKYIKNISPENLIKITEPSGKPCRCVAV